MKIGDNKEGIRLMPSRADAVCLLSAKHECLLSEQVNRKVPKYTNARQVQEAIKFLTEKECRKNRECISLADQILCSAQKKMLSSCELWICSAFFYLSKPTAR
ncbi:hypothetical protein BLNAU_16796 [Blattamonas nauphoetae]|uniref:Uncharacterized protein n=1 Tax=Blattamonas nauphoetae TaxID=2049346 RepID=A0ABQ9X459_9EUKA|nr:hypothetical protein BLNAU_18739 [Blattamonas nauphoetae]KAK2948260.1 hypothetical protein BLNAU_16796 [Blattamonas nauphoetae]